MKEFEVVVGCWCKDFCLGFEFVEIDDIEYDGDC